MAARKYRFERLTPIDNMDLNVYEEAIDYVFSNSDVKNVAISGAYSAGKSSVLASYKKKHGELRFLHIFLGSGVLNELSRYLGENVDKQTHNIKDLLYNIPCVHRSFAITYTGTTELFVPIRNLKFIREDTTSKAWVQFDLDARYANASILRYLPAGYKKVPPNPESNTYTIRKENSRFNWNIHSDLNQRMQDLSNYHRKVRKDLFYIYGDTKLWYLKKNLPNNTHVLQRNSLTLIFAVMHWMSELVRYNPQKFEKLMESKQNWLLHEFIEKALYQFVDEISCEITHQEIMTTGYRK